SKTARRSGMHKSTRIDARNDGVGASPCNRSRRLQSCRIEDGSVERSRAAGREHAVARTHAHLDRVRASADVRAGQCWWRRLSNAEDRHLCDDLAFARVYTLRTDEEFQLEVETLAGTLHE